MRIRLKCSLVLNALAILLVYFFMDVILGSISSFFENVQVDEFAAKIARKKYDVNCRKILEMDKAETERAASLNDNLNKSLLADANFVFPRHLCGHYKQVRGFVSGASVDQFEVEFPLAYTILTHDKAEQFER